MATAFWTSDVLDGFGYAAQRSASTATATIVELGSSPSYSYLVDRLTYPVGLRMNTTSERKLIAELEDRSSNKYSSLARRGKHAIQEPRIGMDTVESI